MIIALFLAIVDLRQKPSVCRSAETQYLLTTRNLWTQNQTDWSCGLTARKEGTYQRGSNRKHRRYVPADRVYYIQSAYSFQ